MVTKIGLDLGYANITLSDVMAEIYREPSVALIYKNARPDARRVISVGDEAVYSDGEDTLYVMDQISDKKNKEENWVEHLSLSEAMKQLNSRENEIIILRFFEI